MSHSKRLILFFVGTFVFLSISCRVTQPTNEKVSEQVSQGSQETSEKPANDGSQDTSPEPVNENGRSILRLVPTTITASTPVCGSGSGDSCLQNGIGFACLIPVGEQLGVCARSADTSASCRCENFAKFEPKVAANDCSSSRSQNVCSGEAIGTECSLTGGGAGYCTPMNFRDRDCRCATYIEPRSTTNSGADSFGSCRTYSPLRGEVGSLMTRVSNPGYTNDGTLRYPNGKVFMLRNSGYRNDYQISYPNEQIMMLSNDGYTNDKTIYWPNSRVMFLENQGYTNDGTIYRQDGSVWLQRNIGYSNDRQRFGLPIENYSADGINVTSQLSGTDGVIAVTTLADPSWSIAISLDGITKKLLVRECLGSGTLGNFAPSPSALTAKAVRESEIELAWTSGGNGVVGHLVAFAEGTAAPVDCSRDTTSPGLATSTKITGLKQGTNYSIRICSFGSNGAVGGSTTLTVKTTSIVVSPSAPDGLMATAQSNAVVALSWQDTSTNESNFEIERAISGGAFGDRRVLPANSTTYSDAGLAASTAYQYRVRSVNTAGSSNWITASVTTPAAPSLPAAPSGFTASATSTTQVALNWQDASDNETSFELERAVGAGTFGDRKVINANLTSFADSGLAASTTYRYQIRSTNSAGPSAWVSVSVTTPSVPTPTFPSVSSVEITTTSGQPLSLAEVEVFAANGGARIQSQGVATQSSESSGGVPARAIDGNTNGSYFSNSVTHTNAQNPAWWKVRFASPVPVNRIVVWNRTDCCQSRLNGATIRVFDQAGTQVFTGSIPNATVASNFSFSIPAR
jgi:hypothetical protein